MTMFRADTKDPFNGPHQKTGVATAGVSAPEAGAAIVLIHGRGATAESILTLSHEVDAPEVHYVAPQADQLTWYPYSFLAPTSQNEPGLSSGLQAIFDIVTNLENEGIPKKKIIIAGFSQGACLATEFVARHTARFGGIIALSGGLIGDSVAVENYSGSLNDTPYFVGCSDIDPHIPVERVHESADIMEKLGAFVTKSIYPGMGHTVNEDEIEQINKMVFAVIRS